MWTGDRRNHVKTGDKRGIPRSRQRNWRKSPVAITNSIRILVFFFLFLLPFLSLSLFPSTDGNFSSRHALACPIPRWFNRGRGVSLYCLAHDQSSNLVDWITRPAVINEIFCNLWSSLLEIDPTSFNLFVSRERRRWVKVIWKKKKRKERIQSLLGKINLWNFEIRKAFDFFTVC